MTDLVLPQGAPWDDVRDALSDLVGRRDDPPRHDGAVVVATSGSSGTPKRVRLPGAALRASGLATAQVLGGHGGWILALPTHHVAGLQVLARSALAGSAPVVLDPHRPFTGPAFAAAVDRLVTSPEAPLRLTSLVPTQLRRLLEDEAGRDALGRLDAVLLGGSAAEPGLLDSARATGCRVVHTYGMSETSGGCVYDGVPLPGVRVRIDPEDSRIHLGGPVLADGYVDNPDLTHARFGHDMEGRWFVTDDRGSLDAEGRLQVLGRVDDVIITGGLKVEPRDVETVLTALPDVLDALVVGVPDPEWGQVVGALVVRAGGPAAGPGDTSGRAGADWPARLREALRPSLPPHALPRRVVATDVIPLLPSGKPDRFRAVDLLRGGRMETPPR